MKILICRNLHHAASMSSATLASKHRPKAAAPWTNHSQRCQKHSWSAAEWAEWCLFLPFDCTCTQETRERQTWELRMTFKIIHPKKKEYLSHPYCRCTKPHELITDHRIRKAHNVQLCVKMCQAWRLPCYRLPSAAWTPLVLASTGRACRVEPNSSDSLRTRQNRNKLLHYVALLSLLSDMVKCQKVVLYTIVCYSVAAWLK